MISKMKTVLERTRQKNHTASSVRKIILSAGAFLLGFLLGTLSKYLDTIPSNELPWLLERFDIPNFWGRLTGWVLLSVILAVFSRTPLRASINVLLFYAGMLIAYCIFSLVFAGFMLDTAYLLIWVVWTLISPLLAYFVWYARGKGKFAIAVSAVIIGFFILQAFSFSPYFDYFDIAYQGVELLTLILSAAVLYVSIKQTLISLALAIPIAYLFRLILSILPFSIPGFVV